MSKSRPGANPNAPKGSMERLGEVRKVYSILDLFTDHKIVEFDAVGESVGGDGLPDWKTVRVFITHPDDPTHGHFAFLREEEFFFDREEAVAFARRALRAHAIYVQTFFSRLQSEQEWAQSFRNKTAEAITRELTEPPKKAASRKKKPSRKGVAPSE